MLERRRPESFYLWMPAMLTVAWVWLTLSLYVRGPYEWERETHWRLIAYIAVATGFFLIGYGLAVRKRSRPVTPRLPRRLMVASAWIAFLPLVASVVSGQFFKSLILARTDLYQAYTSWGGGASFWSYFEILTAPLVAVWIPVGLFYWRRLPAVMKVALAAFILITLTQTAASGRRSGVVNVGIVAVAAVATYIVGLPPVLRRRRMRRFVVVLLAGSVLFVLFLRVVAEGRAAGADLAYNPITGQHPNPDHALTTRVTSGAWAGTFFGAVFYLSHGYYALEKSLEMPWEGITLGVGQSWFLARNAERFGIPKSLLDAAYDRRLSESGYPVGLYWMTIFPWFASDVTFPGTWFLTALFGFLFGRAWESGATTGNPWAVVMFGVLAHFAFSAPMNNPMQDGAGLTRTLGVLLLWYLSRGRRRAGIRAQAKVPATARTGIAGAGS